MVASPFPGMDPYLESPDIWADVHSTLINLFREQLNPQLVLVESVPLIRPDSPVTLDLALALRTAYERARYDLRINYKKLTTPPLLAPDAEWVESLMAHRWCMARQIRDSS